MDLLTINKKDSNADDDKGPKVDAEDRNERIMARNLRIKKRNELNMKKQRGIVTPPESGRKKEVSKGRKQIEESRGRLEKLEKDGFELVTNIKVAGDSRENTRQTEEEETSRLRKERLEQEAKSASEKFEEIVKKWEMAQGKEIPQELHEMLMDQKHLCDSMIEEKNKLINDFKQELKLKDDLYVKTLKKYGEDIDLLLERMKDQTFNMKKFYMDELQNIENAFINERKELLDHQKKEWDDKLEERRFKEVAFLEERFKRVERNEAELNMIRVKDAEEYNEVKIKLETDIQILQQQFEQMKATYQLNQEKLEYNYQVLLKRDEENAKTKAQQKRKITKLQDALTNLKKKLAKQIKQFNDENQQLTEDYKRVTDMFNDLQLKSKHFLAVDLKKFHDIWKMNEDECKKMAQSLLDADRLIHEQQLGLNWKSPEIGFMSNVGPINGDEKIKTAKELAAEVIMGEESEAEDDEFDEETSALMHEHLGQHEGTNSFLADESKDDPDRQASFKNSKDRFRDDGRNIILNLSKYTLRKIIMLICDEAGFLLEQKLVNLLEPLEKNEQSMVKLDSIFKSLGVETESDVRLLAQYFVNVQQYKDLIKNKSYVQQQFQESDEAAVPSVQVPVDTVNLIHPNDVIFTLKAFLSQHHKNEKRQKNAKFQLTNLDNRNDSVDEEYWRMYENLIDPKKEKVWDAMLYALQKYHGTLNRRAELIEENKSLANQNIELRMLLAQYMQSNINQELQIPPTKILQMEYSK